jgi:hypothetical protein
LKARKCSVQAIAAVVSPRFLQLDALTVQTLGVDWPSEGMTISANELALIAQAEKILNRTLAYQASAAVHELRDQLDLSVGELRLVVVPKSAVAPGYYRVICTIASLAP